MTQKIQLRRSATPGNIPTIAQLDLGEIAINTNDGKLYIKKDDGAESIVEVGAPYSHPTYTSRSVDTSGIVVLDTFTSDGLGHVTGITTRSLPSASGTASGVVNTGAQTFAGVKTYSSGLVVSNGPGTIAGATFDNGWLRIGTSTLGWAFDNNEMYAAGAGIIGSLDGGSLTFNGTMTFNGRPAFNGGDSGTTSPFTVDSTQVVTNLNADLLDGQQGSYYLNYNNLTNTPTIPGGTVTSVSAGAGMNFTAITSSGSVAMGTPSTLTASTSNSASGTTHTHAITGFAVDTAPVIKSASSADDAAVTYWNYGGSNAYRLRIDQRVTSGVVRWSFSQTNNSTEYNDVLLLDRGNVGLGIQDPTEKLHVVGNIKSSGSLTTGGNIEVAKTSNPILILNDTDSTNNTNLAAWVSFQRQGTEAGYVGFGSSSTDFLYVSNNSGPIHLSPSTEVVVNSNLTSTGDMFTSQHKVVTSPDGPSGDFNSLTEDTTVGALNATANSPYGNYWYNLVNVRHRGGTGDGTQYGGQLAWGMTSGDGQMAFRRHSGSAWSAWHPVFTDTTVNKITTGNLIYEKDGNLGFVPLLAQHYQNSSTVTGAIKIAFPTHGTADMICGYVDIFDYTTNESVSLFIAGYLYQATGSNEWVNLTVTTLTQTSTKDYTVRFGGDGSKNCIWIGELASTWSYPQITLRDWTVGYTSDVDAYATGTVISFVTAFDTVQDTVSSNLPVAQDSALLAGAAPSVSASNSTIVQRHSSGYIYANYFNTSPNDIAAGSITKICAESGNDGFIRHATAASVANFLSGSTMNIAGSSTSCTGNAATATTATNLSGGSVTAGGLITTASNSTDINSANDTTISVRGSDAASMSFHRPGAYAVNLGLDTDNVFKLGGWSAVSTRHSWDMSGNYTATGNVTAYSDPRLKENIKVIDSPLAKLCSLDGVEFTWKKMPVEMPLPIGGKADYGVLADQVEQAAPYAVLDSGVEAIDGGENYKTVAYDKLVPLLIESIKEQQTQINELKAMIMEMNK